MARKKKLKQYNAVIGERADGVKVTKPFYGLTMAEAKQKAQIYQDEIGFEKHKITDSEFYFRGWAKRWLLTYKEPSVKKNSYYTTYENPCHTHIIPAFGDDMLVDITPEKVKRFYNAVQYLSQSMCSKISMCINGIFETAIDNDMCFKNPTLTCGARFTACSALSAHRIKVHYCMDPQKITVSAPTRSRQ